MPPDPPSIEGPSGLRQRYPPVTIKYPLVQKLIETPVQLSSEVVRKSSEVVENLKRSSEVFRNLQQSLEAVGKCLEIQILWRRKISCILLKKGWQLYQCSH